MKEFYDEFLALCLKHRVRLEYAGCGSHEIEVVPAPIGYEPGPDDIFTAFKFKTPEEALAEMLHCARRAREKELHHQRMLAEQAEADKAAGVDVL